MIVLRGHSGKRNKPRFREGSRPAVRRHDRDRSPVARERPLGRLHLSGRGRHARRPDPRCVPGRRGKRRQPRASPLVTRLLTTIGVYGADLDSFLDALRRAEVVPAARPAPAPRCARPRVRLGQCAAAAGRRSQEAGIEVPAPQGARADDGAAPPAVRRRRPARCRQAVARHGSRRRSVERYEREILDAVDLAPDRRRPAPTTPLPHSSAWSATRPRATARWWRRGWRSSSASRSVTSSPKAASAASSPAARRAAAC